MNYWVKIIIGVSVMAVSIIAWVQFNSLTKSSKPIPPIVQKLNFEGTIGGKHVMKLSLDQVGPDFTGSAVNTNKDLRKLKGSISEDKTFLIHEYDGDEMTGTFEGRILDSGNMRGIWSAPLGDKWFPFYLNRKLRMLTSIKNKLN